MKKIFINLIMLVCIIFCNKVNAECEYDGYIVKIKEDTCSLMLLSDEISFIGGGLFHADDVETIYDYIAPENIEAIFPNYEFELYDVDYPYTTSDSEFTQQWYLDKIGAADVREKGLSGEGVKIAVIDSGVNADHPDFNQTNILQGYNCVFGAEDVTDCTDKIGHGTMVTGLIAAQTDNELDISGIASNAQIIPIKVTDTYNFSMSNLFAGLERALKIDCDIINMSFGTAITDAVALATLKEYIDEAEEKGIIVVAAVGNSGNNIINYPAGFKNVVGVGSVDEDLNVSYYSQKNNSVFITAPGNKIVSLSKDGSVISSSGTSLSAPVVTAAIAIIKEVNPNYTLQDIQELLKKTSVEAGDEGYDVNYGYGILSLSNIIEEINPKIPQMIISQGIKDSKLRIHIHNNSDISKEANAFFASQNNKKMQNLNMVENISLNSGVTNINSEKRYECFFLWDLNCRPYTEKYFIK